MNKTTEDLLGEGNFIKERVVEVFRTSSDWISANYDIWCTRFLPQIYVSTQFQKEFEIILKK